MTFVLAGNQNCGKTTVFNQLTGSRQHVGNWPGVTVENKEGVLRQDPQITLLDLPGIYSFSPYTPEEVIARDAILRGPAHAIINVLDATRLERNLYLTLQLRELGKPMVVALNMMDEAAAQGIRIDTAGLAKALGIPVVPICARRGQGLDTLIVQATGAARQGLSPTSQMDIYTGPLHTALRDITALTGRRAKAAHIPPLFAAVKLLEDDPLLHDALSFTPRERNTISATVARLERALGLARDEILPDARYRYIDTLVKTHVKRRRSAAANTFSNKIDRILTHPLLAFPFFLTILALLFMIPFGAPGRFLSEGFAGWLARWTEAIASVLSSANVDGWLYSLCVDGILRGVTAVLKFMPVILLLFLCISLLEDSGYMARAAFLTDRLLSRVGLSGRSFIPLLMGFGCSVPAVMAARTIQSERDRRLTILLTPFMSCGAKAPLYALFTAAFFARQAAAVTVAIYLTGILVAALCGLLITKRTGKGQGESFFMELPPYRPPAIKNTALLLWDKGKDFVQRAFTLIFCMTVVVWFLQYFTPSLTPALQNDDSMLAAVGYAIRPVFVPLGFGTWPASTAVLSGLPAKEGVVSSLAVVCGVAEKDLPAHVAQDASLGFTPLSALSFMLFNLLCMPCFAALAAMGRELGKMRYALAGAFFQTGTAWTVCFLLFQGGRLLGFA